MQLYDFKEIQERVILVGVQTDIGDDVEASLDELQELAETAGAETAAKVIQNREAVHSGTYIGKGKIQEVKNLLTALDANGIICDDELSPSQLNNLERELECKVMDRTLLILGGGIGTRGPGEKKLETDRRLIRTRISALKAELVQVEKHRELIRGSRSKGRLKTAAIVGYTNAGKSTLLNTLTGAGVQAEDKLFATLDPTTRVMELDDGQQILLTDTVGFIRKLPHHLVEAFKSTLEEAKYADYIIHVVDASNPRAETQMQVVYETLKELGVSGKKIITLLNKQDLVPDSELRDLRADYTVKCSARTGRGLCELRELLSRLLAESQIYIEELYAYKEAGKIQMIREYGQLLSEEYREDGIFVQAKIPAEFFVNVMPRG